MTTETCYVKPCFENRKNNFCIKKKIWRVSYFALGYEGQGKTRPPLKGRIKSVTDRNACATFLGSLSPSSAVWKSNTMRQAGDWRSREWGTRNELRYYERWSKKKVDTGEPHGGIRVKPTF